MTQFGRSGARLALALLCVFAPAAMAQNRAPDNDLKMPNVLWLERKDALILLRTQLHQPAKVDGEAGIVIAQDPPPDAKVSGDGVIVLVVGMPNLILSASPASSVTDQEVNFGIAFEPPPANPAQVEYHFVWDDGSELPTREPRTTRAFSEARTHTIAAYAVINDRWKTGLTSLQLSVVPPLPPPPPPVTKLTLSTAAVNPRANEDVAFNLAFDPLPPFPLEVTYRIQWGDGSEQAPADQANVTHRYAAPGNYAVSATALIGNRQVESNTLSVTIGPATTPSTTTPEPPVVDTTASSNESVPDPVPPPPIPWLAILAVAVILTATALLVRALRPKAPASSPPPATLSIKSGLDPTDHTIEHADRITNGLSVRLRAGIRSAAVAEGGSDA